MNICYLSNQLVDELDGAEDYIKRAFELKPNRPDVAMTFANMAKAELEHASDIYKMVEECTEGLNGSFSELPKYLENAINESNKVYKSRYTPIMEMVEMF